MKVTAILKGAKDSLGRQKVYIRTYADNKRTFRATTLKIEPVHFRKGVIVNHPKAKQYNEAIREAILKMEMNHRQPKYNDGDLRAYVQECFRQWNKTKQPSTLRQYESEFNRFVKFAGEIKLSKITTSVLNDYKVHVLRTRTINTAWKTFKFLKTILNKAHRERVIEDNPFRMFENVRYRNPHKSYLTKDQVAAIDKYVSSEHCPDRLAFIGNWFLIGCYTGLRYSDMFNFSASKVIGDRLSLHTTKTNELVSLPIKGKLKELLERVKYKALDLTNYRFNSYLKDLGKAADVPIPISCHQSRHTFAVRCADAGISMEVTAKLMGLTNIRTVAVYYKLSGAVIDEQYDKLIS